MHFKNNYFKRKHKYIKIKIYSQINIIRGEETDFHYDKNLQSKKILLFDYVYIQKFLSKPSIDNI